MQTPRSFLEQIRLARAPLAAFAAMGIAWGAYAALVPDTKAMLGASDALFGSLLLATPLAAVTAMLLAPRVAPRIGPHVLSLAVLALALAFTLPGWQSVAPFFAGAMLLVGLTNGFLDVVMTARVSAIEAERGLSLMNLNHAAYSFGYAGAAFATGAARSLGASPGQVLTGASLALLLLAAATWERRAGATGLEARGRQAGGGGGIAFWGGLVVLVAFMAENAAENWSALHIERTLGGSKALGSSGPAILALTMGFGRIAGQLALARVAEGQVIARGAMVAAAGFALAALAPSPAVAYVGLIIVGLGASVVAPTAFTAIGRLASAGNRGRVIARATALGYLGYFFGPPVLGLTAEFAGLRMAFLGMGGAVLSLVLLVPVLARAGRRVRPADGSAAAPSET